MAVNNNIKIALVGRIAEGQDYYDGQTIKTRNMLRLLRELYGDSSICVVDTVDWRSRIISILVALYKALRTSDVVVLMVSGNGRRVLYPLLGRAALKKGVLVCQNLIGGSLAKEIESHPRWVDYLNEFTVNWVESTSLVEQLEKQGVRNAAMLPNFKYINRQNARHPMVCADGVWHFCTFSRVTKSKGIEAAAATIEQLNAENRANGNKYYLSVYGQIEEGYQERFEEVLAESPHVEYRGKVEPSESLSVLAGYDALLFPTSWKSEGMPGTIIDALVAGTPVLSSHWPFYEEMLADGVTGFSYPFGQDEQLIDIINTYTELSARERDLIRVNCIARGDRYDPAFVAKTIDKKIKHVLLNRANNKHTPCGDGVEHES